MLCQECSHIPLDLFLPKWGSARWFKNGLAWKEGVVYRKGGGRLSVMRESAEKGCGMCSIMLGALDNAEPLWAVNEFTSRGHTMLLKRGQQQRHPRERDEEEGRERITLTVHNEGEMVISDGRRKGGLYWELKSEGWGRRLDQIHDSADCAETLAVASEWLNTCVSQHKACGEERDTAYLPSRLIKVNEVEGQLQPRLVSTSDWSAEMRGLDYFALSYCWGTDRGKTVAKTMRDTLLPFHGGISMDALPKTFRDAMQVVRSLGYSYIWIDSLCIVQDDPDDFGRECIQMGKIYANSICTISAASSPDGDGGCFLSRDPSSTRPCSLNLRNNHIPYQRFGIMDIVFGRRKNDPEEAEVTIYPNFGPWVKAVDRGPVSRRGWCLQERELSPRVLHFTRDRIVWECREFTAEEDKREMVSKAQAAQNKAAHLSSLRVMDDRNLHTVSSTQNRLLNHVPKWDMLAEAYSRRKLSVQEDKLRAISGLAASLSRLRPDDEYLAGLWRGNLLKGLCWIPVRDGPSPTIGEEDWPPAATDPGIPSWSWASYDGEIKFCGNDWFSRSWTTVMGDDGEEKWVKKDLDVEVMDACVQLTSPGDVFGRVDGGEIVLQGWQLLVDILEGDLKEVDEGIPSMLGCKEYSLPQFGATVYFDHDPEALPTKMRSFRLFQLGTGKNMRGCSTATENGLVLAPSSVKRGSYRRVGLFDIEGDKTAWHGMRGKGRVSIV